MKTKVGNRRRSREIALQILYQMEISEAPPEEAIRLFYEVISSMEEDEDKELAIPESTKPFAEELVYGVENHQQELDRILSASSQHWRLERMSIVDRNILRIALYEMLHRTDIPPKVSINEAIEIGKAFGSEDSGAFINGILDNVLSTLLSTNAVDQDSIVSTTPENSPES